MSGFDIIIRTEGTPGSPGMQTVRYTVRVGGPIISERELTVVT